MVLASSWNGRPPMSCRRALRALRLPVPSRPACAAVPRPGAADDALPFHRAVAVHQLDPEALRLRVDHHDVADGEPVEGVAGGLFVEVRTGDVDGRLGVDQRLRDQLADDPLAQAGDEHEMT